MHSTERGTPTKTIMITVNGEPIGRKLIIDSVTYAPIAETEWNESIPQILNNSSAM